MKIEVHKDYIDVAQRHSTISCPVALALQDQLGVPEIRVGFSTVFMMTPQRKDVWKLPTEIADLVWEFDVGEGMKPFHFTLPDKVVKHIKSLSQKFQALSLSQQKRITAQTKTKETKGQQNGQRSTRTLKSNPNRSGVGGPKGRRTSRSNSQRSHHIG